MPIALHDGPCTSAAAVHEVAFLSCYAEIVHTDETVLNVFVIINDHK